MKRTLKRFGVLFLAVAIAVCFIPTTGFPVYAETAAEITAPDDGDQPAADSTENGKGDVEQTGQNEESQMGETNGEESQTETPAAEEPAAQNPAPEEAANGNLKAAGDEVTDQEGDSQEAPKTATITYVSESKVFETQTVELDESGSAAAEVIHVMPARDGIIFDYVFCGWSTNKNASPTSTGLLKPGDTFDVNDNMTLYAIWGEYEWGQSLHAAGNGTTYVYDGNPHSISGVLEKPDKDRKSVTGENYSTGYFYQPLWYSLNVWRYTQFTNIYAERTDVGSKTTPTQGQVFAEIWRPWPWDNSWVLVEDTFTQIWPATIHITAAPLKVTAEDQRVKYTGSAITPEGTLSGLVTPTDGEQETATLQMDSFKDAGVHPMTYKIVWDGTAKKGNYKVTEEDLGNLTIYYELSFDANGGEGAPATMEVESDTAKLPSEKPTLDGEEFLGWATSAGAKSAQYQPGEEIKLSDNTTLYAVYSEHSYSFTAGAGQTWTKGSEDTADFTVERSVKDELSFDRFTGVEVDGKALSAGDYTATKGSVELSLSAEYLETLSVGEHSITCSFSDGSATASFNVAAAAKDKEDSPETGDQDTVLPYVLGMFVSAMMLAALLYRRKVN